MMAIRVQVVLDEPERQRFRREAAAAGVSLSAWLREAGRQRIQRHELETRFRGASDLHQFFRACDERESGVEPEWEEHLRVIDESRRGGASNT